MDYGQMKSIIEGLLFVSGDEGLDAKQIAEVLEQNADVVGDIIDDLAADFRRSARGIQIVEIGGVYQFATLPEHSPYYERLAYSPSRSTLSQAALETLAIVAYKQPITRIEIEEIRGVKSDRAIQSLTAKQLIDETGRADALGRPILYGTTRKFLDYFGLRSIRELPELSSFAGGSAQALEEETKRLLAKWEEKQLTIDDVNE